MSSSSLTLGRGPSASTLTLHDGALLVHRAADTKWPKVRVPVRDVLWAGVEDGLFELSMLARRKRTSPYSLLHITGAVSDADHAAAAAFADTLMTAAYPVLKRQRRLKVFVNPKSGPGKAASLYRKRIEPIFRAARCDVDLTFTCRGKQAQEIIETLPLDEFDAVVVMSGDGLIHEVFNGFAAHAEPAKAFRTPVTPIPTGSGNALAINLLGLEDAKDICVAALNAIKGQPMPVDLFSLTQGGERHISFMSQSLGLIADLDLGTEHLRFMGGQRFLVGFIYGLIRHRSCPVKVSIKVAHADKHKMVRDTHAARAAAEDAHAYAPSALTLPDAPAGSGLPPLQHADVSISESSSESGSGSEDGDGEGGEGGKDREDGEGWITFDRPLVYLFAGKGPYVSSDVLQFPMSLPTDGLIDVTIQERTTRTAMFKAIDGSQRGEHFWQDTQHYYKAHAYRVEPLASSAKGWLSVDGEAFPLAPFQVEVHARLGTLLSMYGAYQLDFDAHGGGGGRGGKDRARP